MNRIKAIVKRPAIKPFYENIRDELEDYQKAVGGNIEAVNLYDDVWAICDEEGILKNYPYNCTICGIDFVGTVLIVGIDGEGFADVPIKISELKELMEC